MDTAVHVKAWLAHETHGIWLIIYLPIKKLLNVVFILFYVYTLGTTELLYSPGHISSFQDL